MIKNYFKIALRNLKVNPTSSLIKIFGLTFGIVSTMLISFHIKNELSYDKGFVNSNRIFRVTNENFGEGARHWAATPFPMGPELKEHIPEVESTVRLHRPLPYQLLQYNPSNGSIVQFEENNGFFSDSDIIKVFDLEFLKGNPNTALTEMNTVVVSEAMAYKYFGSENPIGKSLKDLVGNQILKVTGVLKNRDFNSHLKFDYLISMPTITNYRDQGALSRRGWAAFYTYVLLNQNTSVENLESKMESFMIQFYKKNGETPEETLSLRNLHLQSIKDIHLHSKLEKEMYPNSDITYVYIFSFLALFILLIAIVNFINISNTQSFDRIKEIGVRKVVGAARKDLIIQFFTESCLSVFLSFLLAVLLFFLVFPYYSELTDKTNNVLSLLTFSNSLIILLLLALIVFLAGIYPALFVTRFSLMSSLKNKGKSNSKMSFVRNSLIVFQFIIAVFMITGTVIVYKQMDFFHNKDLGFDKEQIIAVKMYPEMKFKYQALYDELQKNNGIVSFSTVSKILGDRFPSFNCVPLSDGIKEGFDSRLLETDEEFISTLNLNLKEGRNFFEGQENKEVIDVILNESAVKISGYSSPIGKEVLVTGRKAQVIGVVKDFNYASLHSPIEPLVIIKNTEPQDQLLIKIKEGQISSSLNNIKTAINKVSSNSIFTFSFVDDQLNNLYDAENKMRQVFSLFALLSIIISCLGLYTLSAYAARIRVKEIGIRKVLGSSTFRITKLLTKDFLKLVIIALCLAMPITYIVMKQWLQNFAYHIRINPGMFIFSAVLVICIAIITLSYQSIKAAIANPIKSLRTE